MVKIVFGVDILPYHSPESSREARYAVVILKDGKVVSELPDVPLRRLIRLIWEYKPNVIGIDNVFELGGNERGLARIMSLLPSNVDIVQVTLSEKGFEKLRSVARKYGIEIYGKPTPIQTAYTAALLALEGVGVKVKAVEEKTKIIVSKGRSISHGGMSLQRYKRHIRGLILRTAKRIKSTLEKYGIDYDMVVRRSEGGLEGCIFTVYVPREKLYGIIKPTRNKNVRVIVRPIYKSEIVFERITEQVKGKTERKLIVGVDPGMVTGVAAVDTNGELILLDSKKDLDRSTLISMIMEKGKPIVIATDKNPPPDAVVKLASMLNAELYVPPHSLTTIEKNEIVESYVKTRINVEIEDNHQRDALAAALRALKHFEPKMKQVEAYLEKIDLEISMDKIKEAVIRGLSVAEAVEREIGKFIEDDVSSVETETKESRPEEKVDVSKYLKRIDELERDNQYLRIKIRKLQEEIKDLKMMLEIERKTSNVEVKAMRELSTLNEEVKKLSELVRKLDEENANLRTQLSKYETFIVMVGNGTYKVARNLKSLTMDSIKNSERNFGKIREDEIVYVADLSFVQDEALKYLSSKNIGGIIVDRVTDRVKELVEKEYIVPIVEREGLEGIVTLESITLYPKSVEDHILKIREKLHAEYREKHKLDLESLIQEYRSSRWSMEE